jgi:long-chain acyl-CoA synthetase
VNLVAVLDAHPDEEVALISRGRRTTYGELRRQTAELRHGLATLGVGPGDRVAIVVANNWYFAVGFLAVVGSGAVAVPLNPGSPPAELARQLATAGARVAIAGPGSRATAATLDPVALGVEHLVLLEPNGAEGVTAFDDLFTGEVATVAERAATDLACLLFTAGTAGPPKAAMLTHGNLLANQEQMQHHPTRELRRSDVSLGVIPLHHVYGLNVVLLLSLRAGATVVLVERFDPASSLETIVNHRVSVVAGVPAMWRDWMALPAPADAFAGVRLALSGAAPLGASVAAAYRSRYGLTLSEGYGLTEASPTVTSSAVDAPVKDGSIGPPLPGIELRLVDEDGVDALAADPGEIWVRGPNVFAGYWEDEEATGAVLTGDGWLRTGDIAVADDEGWLYIVDRAKDVINVSGFNVYPAEVEHALAGHPGVAAVVVVGVAHPHSGETVKAYVVGVPGQALEEDDLIEFCATRLARYKCPTKVMFVDELPYGLTGKVLRRALQ